MSRQVLTSEEFFQIAERKPVDIAFPEAGNGAVIPIVGLSPNERTAFERDFQSGTEDLDQNRQAFREKLVAACARNDDGTPIFTADQVNRLGQSNGALVERLFDTANRLSGFTNEDIEATIKNSGTIPADD